MRAFFYSTRTCASGVCRSSLGLTTDATPTSNLNPTRQTLNAVAAVRSLFVHLHNHGCDRDKAKNRKLHDDDLLTLVILALFQPLARSHRALSQISDLKSVRKRFGIPHASLGSISEAARIFDPTLPRHVLAELVRSQPQAHQNPPLAALNRRLTAIDGTFLDALPRLVESAWGHHRDGSPRHRWRLHLQLDIAESLPDLLDVTGPKNSGPSDEKVVLKTCLRPDRTYLVDCWMATCRLKPCAEQDWSFAIENYHRDLKQNRGVEKCQVRSERAQRHHIGFSLRAFSRLQWHFFTTGISEFEAKLRLIREAVQGYLENPVFRLPMPSTA